MSAVIRSTAVGDINLGDPFMLMSAFADILRTLGDDADQYPALLGVVDATEDEEDSDADWMNAVQQEAAAVLEAHGDKLGDHAGWVLEQLAGPISVAGDSEGTDEEPDEDAPEK